MSPTTSAIPGAITYLVTAATQAYPAASTHVFDGPPPGDFQREFPDMVFIGYDGFEPPGGEGVQAAEGDQAIATLSQGRTRDETFEIVCSVQHWDGNTDLAAARTAAFALLRTFELLLRGIPPIGPGDCTLGGSLGTSGYAQLAGGMSLHYNQDSRGAGALIVFHITCKARLTT